MTMRRLLFLLLPAVLLSLGTVHAACPEDLPSILKGIVEDGETGEPLQDVDVLIVDPSGASHPSKTHTVGAYRGYYEFRGAEGDYEMTFSKPGYRTLKKRVFVGCGTIQRLMVQLPPVTGTLSVTSEPPGAEIFLDDTPIGATTPSNLTVRVGNYTVRVEKEGFLPSDSVGVEVREDETADLHFDLIREVYQVSLEADRLSDEIDAGGEAVFLLQVENSGNVEDTIDLASLSPEGVAAHLGEKRLHLPPGGAENVTLSLSAAGVGNFTVEVRAASRGDPRKSAAVLIRLLVKLPGEYGVHLASNKASGRVPVGREAVFLLTVKNTGKSRDTLRLRSSKPERMETRLSEDSVTLDPGKSARIHLALQSYEAGIYEVEITAASQSDLTKKSTLTLVTLVEELPGLRIGINLLDDLLLNSIVLERLSHRTFYETGEETEGVAAPLIATGLYPYEPTIHKGTILRDVRRVTGDPYTFSSERVLETYGEVEEVIVARGDLSVDSLVAIALAEAEGVPILLTAPGHLPLATREALETLHPQRILLMGGPAAISNGVEAELQTFAGSVERLWGESRIETSLEVARVLGDVPVIVITDGRNPSLGAVIAAAAYQAPLLYVDPQRVPGEVREYLALHKGSSLIVDGTLSRKVLRELESLFS
jgi:hypothetical protein